MVRWPRLVLAKVHKVVADADVATAATSSVTTAASAAAIHIIYTITGPKTVAM